MKLVLIGGGNIGRRETAYETGKIDEEIVKLSNKDNPNFLFIGLASEFSDSYYNVIKNIYKNLGCITGKISNKTLKNKDVVEKKIKTADIIYIGGGNTLKLMSIIKENNMKDMLRCAMEKGCIIAGVSAGAISLCECGLSDALIAKNISHDYVKVEGLAFTNYMFVPHFDKDTTKRKEDLKLILKNTKLKALCLENGTAIKITDDGFKPIISIKGKRTFMCYYEDNLLKENEIKEKLL